MAVAKKNHFIKKTGVERASQLIEAALWHLEVAATVASQLQGIQQLLQAEKQAAEKVSEVHKQKNQRLKQAKAAAQAQTEQYHPQREKDFEAKEAAALGSHGNCSTEVEKDTQDKVTILQIYFRQNTYEVLDNVLAFICDIQREIHENHRING
uniref:V-type proton ATPase subunit G n=1 Tax=Sus scrofa TaxID=9823 RepID=A0A8D1DXL4_PIG